MSENKIKFPVKLASNNPQSFGIADATEISGHRVVDTLSDLYVTSDPILSILKDGSDAIGQEWFVVSEDCKYRLDNWENRKSIAGWTKLPKQELINGKQSISEKDQPSGYAGLDSNGKLPIEKTYGTTATVVDVETYESLPAIGLSGVIYYVSNTSAQYKWSGSAYVDITNGADNAKKNETSIFDCSNGTSTKYYSSLSNAINVVPPAYRTSNRIISYLSTENSPTSAVNYQYHGIDSTTWTDLTKWERIPNQTDLAEIRSDLSETITVLSSQTPNIINGGSAFSIVDENGNEVAMLNSYLKIGADGTLETDGFNSATEKGRTTVLESAVSAITTHPVSVESSADVLNVSDENGNRAVVVNESVEVQGKVKVFSDGRVKTDSFDSDDVSFTINGMQTELARFQRTVFPQINYAKSTFRWLDIGNSHSHCSLAYLNYIAKSQGVDLSNVAFCEVSRGGSAFKDWVNGWNDADTSGEGDQLTGGMYDAVKDFGGLSVKVTGNTYTEVNGTPTPVVDHELGQSSTRFWGGDCSIFRSLLQDNEWDLITIHQRYIYNEKYDESDGWVNDLESGTYTNSGGIKEFVRILKSTNPQATVGFLFALTPFGFNGESVVYDEDTSLNNTLEAHERWCWTVKKFMKDSGVDLVIPCDTALQNLRISNVPNVENEWDESETPTILDIYDRWGFNFDSAHTSAAGVAPYTLSAVAWEMVFAPRFGVSIMENRLHELKANDLGDGTTTKYLQPSYDDNGVDTIIDDRGTNPWNKPLWVGWNTRESADTRATATVRLTDSNRPTCQMAAMLAVSDMWEVNNPNNLTI